MATDVSTAQSRESTEVSVVTPPLLNVQEELSVYRAAAEELRAELEQLREESKRHRKMLYTHGNAGTYELEKNHGLASILGPIFLGDASGVRNLYWDEATGDFRPGFWRWVCCVVDLTIRSFGESVFLDSTWSSLVIIICIFVRDWYSTVLALIAVAVTVIYTVGVRLFPRPMVLKSLYSYNTVLTSIGIALFAHNDVSYHLDGEGMFAFFLANLICFIFVCIFRFSDVLASYTTTYPFAISVVVVLLAASGRQLSLLHFNSFRRSLPLVSLLTASTNHTETTVAAAIFNGIPNGFGELVFCDTWELSFVMWLGVMLHSPYQSGIVLLASTVSVTTAVGLGAPLDEVSAGLWGYNSVACGLLVAVTWPRANLHDAWGTVKAALVTCLVAFVTTFMHAVFKKIFVETLGVPVASWPAVFTMTMYITIIGSPLMFGAKKDTTTTFVKSDATIRAEDSEKRRRRKLPSHHSSDDDEKEML